MTATLDILEDIARGFGPARAVLTLGYSGWGPGQLEAEVSRNGWLTCDPATDLVFGPNPGRTWEAALRSLGIDAQALSSTSGRA
jgi:putative transcriptional regulator